MSQPIGGKMIHCIEREGRKYYYCYFGNECHGRHSFKLWLGFEPADDFQFPFPGKIKKSDKGTLTLVKDPVYWTYDVLIPCGYRGSSDYSISSGTWDLYTYEDWASPLGNLGISKGALIVAPKDQEIKIHWKKTGRLYGSPAEGFMILKNGEVTDLPVDFPEEI